MWECIKFVIQSWLVVQERRPFGSGKIVSSEEKLVELVSEVRGIFTRSQTVSPAQFRPSRRRLLCKYVSASLRMPFDVHR